MDWVRPTLGLRIGGHRGAAYEAPENTFAGFVLAAEAGADYLELDVQLAADRVAVVFHDEDLDRTTDGTGPLSGRSSAELADLDAGAWFGQRFRGARIPTLAGFLDWLTERQRLGDRPSLGATIEAKGPGSGAVIARAIEASSSRDDCSICSFSVDELRAAEEAVPWIARMIIVDRDEPDTDVIALARTAAAGAVNLPLEWLTGEAVTLLHAAGLLVAGGTIDDAAGIAACLRLGVDLVDSNRPSVAVAARNRHRDAVSDQSQE